eukprot:IDg103t1
MAAVSAQPIRPRGTRVLLCYNSSQRNFKERLQNPMGYRVPSGYVCNKAQPIWSLQASVSTEYGKSAVGYGGQDGVAPMRP